MQFGTIDHIILFGGSRVLAEFAKDIQTRQNYGLSIYSCDRQLHEPIYANGLTLAECLDQEGISYTSCPDINTDTSLPPLITKTTVGIGLGEVWQFSPPIIDQFEGRLLDLMGIRLPQYRGGAHYSWQILRKNRIGCCNLQVINEETVQGVFDSGAIVKSQEYFFPPSARIPNDYFETAATNEIAFLNDFLDQIKNNHDFQLTHLQENFSIYFPRLYTPIQGLINWEWDTEDIETFICAFDSPYVGASTFIAGKKVHLKNCYAEYNDGAFHPFQSGLIYKIANDAIFVATRSGTLVIKQIQDEEGTDILPQLQVGQRLLTPKEDLEKALAFSAVYTDKGLDQEDQS